MKKHLPLLRKNNSVSNNRYVPVLRNAIIIFIFVLLTCSQKSFGQLFQQDFSSSSTLATYISAGSPTIGQFNAIGTSGAGTVVTINTLGSNKLRFDRTGNANAGSFSRTTDLTGPPATLMYRFDLAVSGTVTATTTAAVFQIGSGFGTANSAEANAATYGRIGVNTTTVSGTYQLRDIGTTTNSSNISGSSTILLVMNNSGATQTYRAPNSTNESIADDKMDVWSGTTKLFDDFAVTTPTQIMTDLKFAVSASNAIYDIDNILINPIPAIAASGAATSVSCSGFTAHWSTVSGVTGYRIDVATDNAFTSMVAGYNNLFVSGQATNSLAVAGLTSGATYYYRVRSASQFTVGEFASGNSSTQTVVINSPPVISSASITNVSCPGVHNGAINITVSGGTGPYTICWDTINLLNGPAFAVTFGTKTPAHPYYGTGSAFGYKIDGVEGKELTLTRGINYNFSVATGVGHPFFISSTVIGGNLSGLVSSGQSGAPTGTGTVSFTPNNSHPSLLFYACQIHQYMGYNVNIQNGWCVEDPTGLKAGIYTVIVTDANGCTATAQYTVNELPSPVTATAVIINATCSAHNGSINLTPAGGTSPYTICWDTANISNGAMFAVTEGSSTPTNPNYLLGVGFSYYIDGTETKELYLTKGITYSFNVFSPGHPWHISTSPVGGNSTNLVTNGQSGAPNQNGTVTFTPNNAHPTLLYYDCAVHPYMGNAVHIQNGYCVEDLTSLAAGTYSAIITDATGCTATVSYTVGASTSTVTASLNSSTDASCYGLADGTIDLSPAGGVTPYTASGTGPIFTVIAETQNHSHPQGMFGGNGYTIDGVQGKELTLMRGITYAFSVFAPGHAFFISTDAVGGPASVPASEITNGVVNSQVGNGTLYFTPNTSHPNLLYYQCAYHNYMGWKIHIVDQAANGDLNNCMAGNYDLTLTDINGCSSPSPVSVTINEPNGTRFYYDGDSDNYGTDDEQTITCAAPSGFVSAGGDCDDSNSAVNPGAIEICNGIDDNCDGNIDEGITVSAALAGSDQSLCTNSTTLDGNAPALNENGLWQVVSGSGTFTADTQYNTAVTGLGSGANVFSWTLNNGVCATSSDEVTITVNPQPTATITGNNTICLGQPSLVHLIFTGAGPWNYTISDGTQNIPCTSTVNPDDKNIIPVMAGNHIYTITVLTDAICSGTGSGTVTIEVNDVPPSNTISSITGASEACNTEVKLMTANASGGAGITYSWNTGSNSAIVKFSDNVGGPFLNGPFISSSNSVYAQFGTLTNSSGYNVCAQAANGCGSTNNKCTWIRGIVSVPGTITPAAGAVACPNDVKNYACTVSGGAAVYNWTLNGSTAPVTSGQGTTNAEVTFPSGFISGQLCVTAALACGGSSTSAARCMNISKNPAIPAAITGLATVCPGATGVTYSVPAVTGASGYSWTVPASCTITSATNTPSITVNFSATFSGASAVCVAAISTCGSSVIRCKTVSSGVPNQPASINGPTTNVCGSTVQYSVVNPSATSYFWSPPSGTTIVSGQGSATILLNVSGTFNTGNLSVVANSILCSPATSIPRTSAIFGKPNTPGTITLSPAAPFCAGAHLNFSVTNPTSGTIPVYLWTVSNGTITSTNVTLNNIDVTWGTNTSGTITARAGNTCGLSSGTRSQVFTTGVGCREESVNTPSEVDFAVYPNPVHDKITVSIYVNEYTGINLKLRDISGRILLSEDNDAARGLNVYNMDLKNIAKGIYMLEIQSLGDSRKTKVVIE